MMILKGINLLGLLTMIFIRLNEGKMCIDLSRKKTVLFTPGPVTTTDAVKVAMTYDESLTQTSAIRNINYIRKNLLKIDNLSEDTYTVVVLQGSGTFTIEAAIQTATPLNGKVLVLKNGFYGDNLENICKGARIDYDVLNWPSGRPINVSEVEQKLRDSSSNYNVVTMVHHETSFAVLNPVLEIGKLITQYKPGTAFVVDAVSSFACYPVPMENATVAYMISTPNKCLEAFPGMGFIIVRKDFLQKGKDNHRSLALDLYATYETLEDTGDLPFTWPLQVFSALAKGINLFFKEGRENRLKRYQRNNNILREGMAKLKFEAYFQENAERSVLLTTYKWPTNEAFNFTYFVKKLESEGLIIYATPLEGDVKVFRIANMGQLTTRDCKRFLVSVENIMRSMKVKNPYKE